MPSKKKPPGPPRPRTAPANASAGPVVLTPDTKLAFPEFFILSASAGSGKTWALSLRFVQFLLSERVRGLTRNDLPNIMAMTFTRNAAREMKERILEWLKECARGDAERIGSIRAVVSAPGPDIQRLAGEMVDRILARYSDFQVDTIDHFTGAVFRASAVDLGVSPDVETILEPQETVSYAFQRYLRKIRAGSPEAGIFELIVEQLFRNQSGERAFDWDPAPKVREKVGALYGKLAAQNKRLVTEDFDAEKTALEKRMRAAAEEMGSLVESSGLEKKTRSSCFPTVIPAIAGGDFVKAIKASFKTDPVSKPAPDGGPRGGKAAPGRKRASGGAVPGRMAAYERALALWRELESLVKAYRPLYARGFYHPYLLAYQSFLETLDQVKRQQGVVFIDDINQKLSRYVEEGLVPDIYFRLGDRVFHFLIDEFQDTSRIQWENLKPLIENSLAQEGSLFVVGDTKQGIYGFRDADFRIMKALEDGDENPFPSVTPEKRALETNFRCRREILDFVKDKFLIEPEADGAAPPEAKTGQAGAREGEEGEPGAGNAEAKKDVPKAFRANKEKYAEYLKASGLDDFTQDVDPKKREPGHVEYIVLETPDKKKTADAEDGECGPDDGADGEAPPPAEEDVPEKPEVQARVLDLYRRGFSWADIAILTFKNDDVARVSSWLNETPWTDRNGVPHSGIPFIPSSSLDIRKRRIIAEVLALLQFLDSPPDDLSFATFLVGDVFKAKVQADARQGLLSGLPSDLDVAWREFLFECRAKGVAPLYPAFRKKFPELWDRYLERFFKIVGYYPLYDLVTLIYRMFDVFALFAPEEASLTRLLEAIKNFEGEGRNDLREFLELSGDEEGEASAWTIDVPPSIEAVKVMSIHKSKGLTFPAVILLQYAGARFRDEFFFERDEDTVRVLKLDQDLASDDPVLEPIYDEAYDRDKVGSLNALYVAMTRAADELHVIAVKGKRLCYPLDFLGTERYVSKDAEGRPIPPERRPLAPPREKKPAAPVADTLRFRELFELPVNTRETLNRDAIRRGEIAHAILAEVDYLGPDPSADLAAARARLAIDEDEAPVYEEVGSRLARFLADPALRPYFERRPGRTVKTELEVCDRTGRLRRLDRVVLDPGEVFVIEYKTGLPSEPGKLKDWEKEDRQVFAAYLEIMREVHPGRPVRGAFAYVDAGTVEVVG